MSDGNQAVIDAFLTEATRRLNCKATKDQLVQIADAIKTHGNHFSIWQSAVEEAHVTKTRNNRQKGDLSQAISRYLDLCDKHIRYECPKCEGSGFLSVILIHGIYHTKDKTYIYDPYKVKQTFLIKMAEAGIPFEPEWTFVPCRCKNGDKKNKRHDQAWLSDRNRREAYDRCFVKGSDDAAEYWADAHRDAIYRLKQGEPFRVIHWQETETFKQLFGDKEKVS